MKSAYPTLLSPIKIGSTVLKNHMIGSAAIPHYLMGPETFPGEELIEHIANGAKNGAAVVTLNDFSDPNQRKVGNVDGRHFPMFDLTDDSVYNYLSQLADTVHYYNSKISVMPSFFTPKGQYLTDFPACTMEEALKNAGDQPVYRLRLMSGDFGDWKGMTEEQIDAYIDSMVERVHFYKLQGFDMATFHMAYCMTFLSQCLSPLTNFRTDQYGGSLENRARLPLKLFRKIKEVCGKDFLIEAEICGREQEGGLTTEDIIAFGRMAEGLIDIFQVRDEELDTAQPVPFNSVPHVYRTLETGEKIKKAGVPQKIGIVGGYQWPEDNEKILAEGKADLIVLARSLIADPEYGKKLQENRADDIVPCIRCNRCHGLNMTGPWLTVCSVNPAIGMTHKIERMGRPFTGSRKIAVIGGGPAGMRAALFACERGHDVTLYEKEAALGGQLFHADYVPFKWNLKRYKDYLIHQLEKHRIRVLLNTEATPELIEREKYDAVIAATGAVQKLPPIRGAETSGALSPLDIYGREDTLGEHIVVVGGSETGTETALYLAELGHKVDLLSRQPELAKEATPTHYRAELLKRLMRTGTLTIHTNAATTEAAPGCVTYTDPTGEHRLEADTIILSGGVRPLQEEALAFYGSAPVFDFIGDCRKVGNIQTCTRTAYAAASML